jgi:hypothetical protein
MTRGVRQALMVLGNGPGRWVMAHLMDKDPGDWLRAEGVRQVAWAFGKAPGIWARADGVGHGPEMFHKGPRLSAKDQDVP